MVSRRSWGREESDAHNTMTDPIMPEIDRARALLNDIGWDNVKIETVTGGSVNRTFHLTRGKESWYLRIGPTDAEASDAPTWFTSHGLRHEQRAIAHWANHQRYFPETVHTDFTRSQIGSDWVIQKAIPGLPWNALRARLNSTQTASLWRQLGTLAAELHAYIGPEFGPMEPGHGFSRWSELIRWDVTGLLTDARRYNLPLEPFTYLCNLVDLRVHELDEITKPRLIHSDLGMRHVLVEFGTDGEPMITGLIDLEFARFADAYSESIFVAKALESQHDPMFDHFLEAYGAVRPDRSGRMRSLIYQLIALAWWVTDAMRRQRKTEANEMLDKMRSRIDEDKHIW